MEMTLQEVIEEALEEARILECAFDEFNENRVIYVAQKLSGAPYSFIKEIYSGSKKMHFAC